MKKWAVSVLFMHTATDSPLLITRHFAVVVQAEDYTTAIQKATMAVMIDMPGDVAMLVHQSYSWVEIPDSLDKPGFDLRIEGRE